MELPKQVSVTSPFLAPLPLQVELHHLQLLTPLELAVFLESQEVFLDYEGTIFDRLTREIHRLSKGDQYHWAYDAVADIIHYDKGPEKWKLEWVPKMRPLLLPYLRYLKENCPTLNADIDFVLQETPQILVALALKQAAEETGEFESAHHYGLNVMALLIQARLQMPATVEQQRVVEILRRVQAKPSAVAIGKVTVREGTVH